MSAPNLSEEQIKAGIFDGPKTQKILKDFTFEDLMNSNKRNGWFSFVDVAQNFLEDNAASNYKKLRENILESYHKLDCNICIKIYLLFRHLDQFPKILDDVIDEMF